MLVLAFVLVLVFLKRVRIGYNPVSEGEEEGSSLLLHVIAGVGARQVFVCLWPQTRRL